MNVIHRQHLAPSGVEYACQLSITPSTLKRPLHTVFSYSRPRPMTNLIVARGTVLKLYELCRVDDEGEAFLSNGKYSKPNYKLFHVREHRLHGKVTGLQRVATLDTVEDGLDRLLISFEDAKMTLMEWSTSVADLVPISLHTFEKLPQITQGDLPRDYHAQLETDPLSRCSVLLLPQSTLAVLPFFQDQLDLDALGLSASPNNAVDADPQRFQSFPYAPSFILDLNQQLINHQASTITDQAERPIKSILSAKFLPGFSEPTLAILYQCQWIWSGRLENGIDTVGLVILTLDLGSNHFPIISHTQKLPYDAYSLVPCPKELGGVLVLCADMLIHVDQSSKIIGVATNGWVKHTTELTVPFQETVELIELKNSQENGEARLSPEVKPKLEDGESENAMEDDSKKQESLLVRLENSKILFIELDLALVFIRDGQIFSLKFERDGRTLLKLSLKRFAARSVVPSTVVRLDERCLFVGSMNGDSALLVLDKLRASKNGKVALPSSENLTETENTDMDIDVDDDIYGEETDLHHSHHLRTSLHASQSHLTTPQNRNIHPRSQNTNELELSLRLCDSTTAHGSIRDFTMAATGPDDPTSLEMLACTGAGDLGGLTVFHREMPLRKRRKLGSSEFWTANTRIQFTRLVSHPEDGSVEEKNLIWIGKDDNTTDIFSYSESKEPEFLETLPSPTIVANPIFGGNVAVQVTKTNIRLLNPDLKEIQVIRPEPPMNIRQAMVTDDHVLLQTTSGNVLIYQGDPESQTLRKLPFPSKTPRIQTASFLKAALPIYTKSAAFPETGNSLKDNTSPIRKMSGNKYVEMDWSAASTNAENKGLNGSAKDSASLDEKLWLLTTDAEGDFHVHDPTTLDVVFTAKRIDVLPENLGEEALKNETQIPNLFGAEEVASESAEKVVQISAFSTGILYPRPQVAVMLASGAFAVYEIATCFIASPVEAKQEGSPAIFLKKVIGRQFEALEDSDSCEDGDQNTNHENDLQSSSNFSQSFKPFTLNGKIRGAFLSGPISVWLISTDHGPCRIYESTEGHLVHDLAESPNGSLITLSESKVLQIGTNSQKPDSSQKQEHQVFLWESFVSESSNFDKEVPTTPVKIGRSFNKVVYDFLSQTVVGASYLETAFANFDEEGNLIWQPDDDSLIKPTTFRSSLELILPGSWITIDGYEFQQNEWVTSMASTDLDSRSTVYGRRSFIGAGTTCNRAEDLAARGGAYVFEVIFVNPPENHPERNRALRLCYHEETKACVTAVDSINGYLLHTMGQKLYAKCFEQDERLLAVGFLDIKPYTNCLRVFKNFIILGDAAKGVTLVAFQEEPYKLIELGHTYSEYQCSTVDFLVIDSKLAIVTTDLDGVIRIFEYNPKNIESQAGQKLLCRTEYQTSSEMTGSMQFGKRLSPKDEAKVMGTLFVNLDGSISSIVPTKDAVYKRLQLVQSRLTRHIQHFSGLNPRGFRTVRNDMVSRAINRGILDGELLNKFELLSVNQQKQISSLAFSDRETVLINLTNLRSLW